MDKFDRVGLLKGFDPQIASLLEAEEKKQRNTIGLIASENIVSPYASCLEGSIFTNKNTEGYPGKRYVSGTAIEDEIELIAIDRLKQLFGCEHANLQSGNASIANSAVLMGLLNPGDTVLSMDLNAGGHLSHGASFNFSGKFYNIINYGVDKESETIDYNEVRNLAISHKPKIIVCGGSSYSRLIDYEKFSEVANEVNAYLWVDAAHIIGLVAAKVIPSPVPYADVVTFSTQKTLRGPRGCGVIMCKSELKKKIDRGVFPGMQGGPKADMIAARAVLFKECMSKEYVEYQKQVLKNANALMEGCKSEGLRIVANGTDTHLFLIDIRNFVENGKIAEKVLEDVGLITNKNVIPFDDRNSDLTSGIRLGSPVMTTRGADEKEMFEIGKLVGQTLRDYKDLERLNVIKETVAKIANKYPMFADKWLPTL